MPDDGLRDRAGRPRSRRLQHGLQRGLQRHPVVLPPPPVRRRPPAPVRPPVDGGVGGLPRSSTSCSPRRVAKVAPEGGRVLVQDYHLALMGSELARLRPDLRTVHFTHTPFADPSVLRMLPTAVGTELLTAHGRLRRLRVPHRAVGRRLPAGPGPPRSRRAATRPSRLRPSSHRCRPTRTGCAPRRPIRRWRLAAGPHRGADRWARPPGHRAGRPDGAVEEPAPRVLGLRGAARAPAPAAGAGGLRGPGLSHPPGPARVSRLPERGGVDGGPHQPAVGHARDGPRSSSRSRTTTRARWPPSPATTSCWSTRCGTGSTWWPRRDR